MIKYLALLLLITINLQSKPEKISSYNELLDVLKNGYSVKVIIDYSKCKLISDNEESTSPNAIGGMEIKNFEYFAQKTVKNDKAFLVFSETQLISHPKYNYVLNYIKVKIEEDGKVKIIARYLDPKNYEIKMDESFFTNISDNNSGISLYKIN